MSLRTSWGSQERHPLGTCQLSSAFLTHFFRFLQHTPGTQIILVLQKRMKTFNREKPGVCVWGVCFPHSVLSTDCIFAFTGRRLHTYVKGGQRPPITR